MHGTRADAELQDRIMILSLWVPHEYAAQASQHFGFLGIRSGGRIVTVSQSQTRDLTTTVRPRCRSSENDDHPDPDPRHVHINIRVHPLEHAQDSIVTGGDVVDLLQRGDDGCGRGPMAS